MSVDAPAGEVGKLAIGAQSVTPLISVVSKNSHLIDTATMKAERIEWEGWKGGAWRPVTINVSFDGSTAVVSGGGWAGTEVASIVDGKIVAQLAQYAGRGVQGEPLGCRQRCNRYSDQGRHCVAARGSSAPSWLRSWFALGRIKLEEDLHDTSQSRWRFQGR